MKSLDETTDLELELTLDLRRCRRRVQELGKELQEAYTQIRALENSIEGSVLKLPTFIAWNPEVASKIEVIKAVRAITDLGLKETKDLVDGLWPTGLYVR